MKASKLWTGGLSGVFLTAGFVRADLVAYPAFTYCPESVYAPAISPDGSRLLTGDGCFQECPGTIRIWDVATGALILRINGHNNNVTSVAWSSDESNILTAGWDASAKLWDSATGQEVRSFKYEYDYTRVSVAVFSIPTRRRSSPEHSMEIERFVFGTSQRAMK